MERDEGRKYSEGERETWTGAKGVEKNEKKKKCKNFII